MTAQPVWGSDPALVSGWAIRDAPAVLRLLLPGRGADDRPVAWSAVARDHGRDEPVDGDTDWSGLQEYPGDGGAPAPAVDHPAGRFSPEILDAMAAIEQIGGARWVSETDPGGEPRSFAELSAGWARRGFVGRAWTQDGQVALAAPDWADSVIVSGPRALADALTATGLEVFPVAPSAAFPVTTD